MIRLPNGTWIRPDAIRSVKALTIERGIWGRAYLEHQVLLNIDGTKEIVRMDTEEQAQALANELAALINKHEK